MIASTCRTQHAACLAAVAAIVLAASSMPRAAGETVSVWLTTGDKTKLLSQESSLTFATDQASRTNTIDVNEGTTYQTIHGFGASLTDSSAWLIWNEMTTSQRDALMTKLFSPTGGIGLNLLRQPMGASDFALTHYTYDDTCCDLSDFSIDHDRAYILPLVKQARALNAAVRVMGSPWSAPAWMKDSNSLYGGKLLSSYYAMYDDYFVKFVQAYGAEGVPIDYVTLQNEPHHEPTDYPGMRWEPAEEADFVKNYLGPAFANAAIATKVIVWDHNWDEPSYPIAVLNDATARPYIDGSAFHCYAGSVASQTQVHDAHPDRNIYFTECTSGEWSTKFENNLLWDVKNILVGNFRNWGVSTTKFNVALDENNGPHKGGCTNCTGIVEINTANGAATYMHDYYALGHFSKFVQRGAARIASNEFAHQGLNDVAFRNPDGSKVVVVLNNNKTSSTFKIRWSGQSITYTLPKQSVATFKW